jgi:hypothetical protein
MTTSKLRQFALSLLRADSEEEVIDLLKKEGYWDDPGAWRLYGDKEGNFATAGGQQSRPEAALVEKIINCVDARLLLECRLRGIDPESSHAPSSVRDAVAQFFEGRRSEDDQAGTLLQWPASKRTEESRSITIAATGDRPTQGRKTRKMCLTITDQAEGQSAKRLPKTILSLNEKNKQKIHFVQGKFNMGGTGALRFCGTQGLQLVISRRHPKLADAERAIDPTVDDWAVTIVRREEPSSKGGESFHSEFTYLAPVGAQLSPRKGSILTFASDTLPLMPHHDEAYHREVQWGTAIKLYEYETNVGQSNVLMKDGLLFALERLLPEIALPCRLHECRGYKGEKERSFETPLAGLVVRLEDGRGNNLEPDFPLTFAMNAEGMSFTGRIYAFREDRAETYLHDEGVIFALNGQAHGYLPKTLFSRPKAVGLTRLQDSLLVLVDCSSLSVRQREDLFMTSRDRLSTNRIRFQIEREIETVLREHKVLRRLQQERREKDVESKLSEEKPLEEVLGRVLKASPTLSTLFLKGQRLSKPFAGAGSQSGKAGGAEKQGESTFTGRRHPTYFLIRNSPYGALFHRNCELGRRTRIEFETDVENEYFDRATDRGSFTLSIVDSSSSVRTPNYSIELADGMAFLNMSLPDDMAVGDSVVIETTVNDPTLVQPFVNMIKVTVLPKQERKGGTPRPRPDRKGAGAGQRDSSTGIAFPQIVPVKTDDELWHRYKFTPDTACHVIADQVDSGGESQIAHTFYINVDNAALLTEMKYSKQDARLLLAKFKYGNVLLGLGMLHADRADASNGNGNGSDAESVAAVSVYDQIRRVSAAVAPVLLPMIDQLSGLDESELGELGIIGEDA